MSDAAGPDGIKLREAQAILIAHLSLLFNLMLYRGTTPPSLKQCRTTLTPKSDQDLDRVDSDRSPWPHCC